MDMKTKTRGFANMSADERRAIAVRGGKAAHAAGTAHKWTADEARAAGRKGGEAVSRDREYMQRIGAKGGQMRKKNREQQS